MEKIKKIVKKIPGVSATIKYMKLKKEFIYDFNFFRKNYSYSKKTLNKSKYNILLIVHSLEKGMCNEKPRQFGKEKVNELMQLLNELTAENNDDYTFAIGINALRSYCRFYKEHNWTNTQEYINCLNFIKKYEKVKELSVGEYKITKKEIQENIDIDYNKFISSRHSVRNFKNIPLKKTDINKAIDIARKSPSACNRQMVKVYNITTPEYKEYVIKKGQGFSGFNLNGINIFIITFDINANYFVGERNQGWFNAGLFSMNLVNGLHSLGIGSCFIQFGNTFTEEQEIKSKLNISESERIAVILATGYYDDTSIIPYSTRKEIKDIYKEI